MRTPASLVLAAVLVASVGNVSAEEAYQYGATEHDRVVATREAALAALGVARNLNSKHSRTGPEVMALYRAEETVGAYVYGQSPWEDEPDRDPVHVDCASYVKENQARFRVVPDGWKGESDYFEPNSFWAEELGKLLPHATEIREIQFDLKFKDLQRAFRHDPRARGMDCTTFYREGVPADQ